MRWDEAMANTNMVALNRVANTNGKWKTKKRWYRDVYVNAMASNLHQ
jgi:hypothetical protein